MLLKGQCHAFSVCCKMLKKCLQIRKNPKIIKLFIYSGLCYYNNYNYNLMIYIALLSLTVHRALQQ